MSNHHPMISNELKESICKVKLDRLPVGTGWVVSETEVVTAAHVICDGDSLIKKEISLEFPNGTFIAQPNDQLIDKPHDVAILQVSLNEGQRLPNSLSVSPIDVFLGRKECPSWISWGFPTGINPGGLGFGGYIRAADVPLINGALAIQLINHDIEDSEILGGISGGPVIVDDICVGIIRRHPPKKSTKIIFATSITHAAETLEPLQKALRSNVNNISKEMIRSLYPETSDEFRNKLSDIKNYSRWLMKLEYTDIIQNILPSESIFIGPGVTMYYTFLFCLKQQLELCEKISILTTNAFIKDYLKNSNSNLFNQLAILGDKLLTPYYSYYFSRKKIKLPEIDLAIIGLAGLSLNDESFDLRTCWNEQVETLKNVILNTRKQVVILADAKKLTISAGIPFLTWDEIAQNCIQYPNKKFTILVDAERPKELNSMFDEKCTNLRNFMGQPEIHNNIYKWIYPQ